MESMTWLRILVTDFAPLSRLLCVFAALKKATLNQSHCANASSGGGVGDEGDDTNTDIKKAPPEKKAIHSCEKKPTSCWLIKQASFCSTAFPFACFTSNGAF